MPSRVASPGSPGWQGARPSGRSGRWRQQRRRRLVLPSRRRVGSSHEVRELLDRRQARRRRDRPWLHAGRTRWPCRSPRACRRRMPIAPAIPPARSHASGTLADQLLEALPLLRPLVVVLRLLAALPDGVELEGRFERGDGPPRCRLPRAAPSVNPGSTRSTGRRPTCSCAPWSRRTRARAPAHGVAEALAVQLRRRTSRRSAGRCVVDLPPAATTTCTPILIELPRSPCLRQACS